VPHVSALPLLHGVSGSITHNTLFGMVTVPLEQILLEYVRFEISMAVTMKNGVFWDIKPSSYFTGDTLPHHYRIQPVNTI
jgi:hypothetical protein